MNIILCGLPMCGKSTIGKILAERLRWKFVDTDQLIEKAYTAKTGNVFSCREIFLNEGEENFRRLEKKQIAALKSAKDCVISIGGGSLMDPVSATILQSIGSIIYLKVPIEQLWGRVHRRGIPAYLDPIDPEKAFYAMAKQRIPQYESSAEFVIDTAKLNERQTAEKILKEFGYD